MIWGQRCSSGGGVVCNECYKCVAGGIILSEEMVSNNTGSKKIPVRDSGAVNFPII